uniref:Odorant receptor n=1 Tax=Drosophila pseudoobscura pseudoobscura TaxID=46245 RepID=E5AJV2_DROPS|nr:odorant receptor [Drosophila pseudoobscura pseudoobscura]
MQLEDLMRYPDIAFRYFGMAPRFEWTARRTVAPKQTVTRQIVFMVGSLCLGYQNLGMIIYWVRFNSQQKEISMYVAKIAEMGSVLALIFAGFLNIWALTSKRAQIEAVLAELQEMYPEPRQRLYRIRHYNDQAVGLMKFTVNFYVVFIIYYNIAPLVLLLCEHLMDSQDISYRTQSYTWYPWQVYGSPLGYSAAYLCQAIGSILGVGFSMSSQQLICLFTTQLQLHFDAMANHLTAIDAKEPTANQQLRSLILYHRRILRLGDRVNRLFNFTFVVSLIVSTIAICLTSIATMLLELHKALLYISGLIAFVFYHFLICYRGSVLTLAMQLADFMQYSDLGCQVALIRRYGWSGRQSPGAKQTLMKKVIFVLGALNMSCYFFSFITYGYHIERKTMEPIIYVAELSEVGGMLWFTVLGICNMYTLLIYRPQIEELLEGLEQLFAPARQSPYCTRYFYDDSALKIKRLSINFVCSATYYNLLPLVKLLSELLTESQQVSYQVQSKAWYPWQVHGSTLGFWIAYASQAFASVMNLGMMMATECLVFVCTAQLELHFDGLARRLEALDARDPRAKEQLRALISYHTRLFKVADRANGIFNCTFLISYCVSSIAVCSMGFSMIMFDLGLALKYMVGMFLFMIYTFCICHNGTQVTLASDKVMPAAFYNNWYEGDLVYRKMLLILMMRSTKSYVWKTYNLAPVSIQTYMATLKFSYQMFTCVRSLK